MMVHEITCSAPVNIAVVKYWGKRDEELVLPLNSSISVTLNQDHLRTKTTIRADSSFSRDRIFLNGVEEDMNNIRIQNVLRETRELAKRRAQQKSIDYQQMTTYHLHIVSENNFPTGAGLASSASGYACLVFALAKLFQLEESLEELSCIARQGSGSACRSLFGGFSLWELGHLSDGSDSRARSIAPATHWPDLEILILVIDDHKKIIDSTRGMNRSRATSSFLTDYRAPLSVPKRIENMLQAIQERNFNTFAEITMKDSNQFHAVCMDTYPPIFYLNDTSRHVIRLITAYNEVSKGENRTKIAYTFDAGPNAILLGMREDIRLLMKIIHRLFFSSCPMEKVYRGFLPTSILEEEDVNHADLLIAQAVSLSQTPETSLLYMIHTTPGDGPRVLDSRFALKDIAQDI